MGNQKNLLLVPQTTCTGAIQERLVSTDIWYCNYRPYFSSLSNQKKRAFTFARSEKTCGCFDSL